jgi:tetratricopeptide (TPR) repeat protein
MMFSSIRYEKVLALCILLCLIVSCSTVETATKTKDTVQTRPQTSNDYQDILNDWKAEHARNPKNQEIMKNYAKAVEGIKTEADKAYEKENYASSGRIYGMLLKNYPGFKRFGKLLSFDRQQLKDRLSSCKTVLYQRGFEQYRNNHLNEAILSWQSLLSIDPHNEDIRKAVNTAVLQRKNLR